MLSIAVRSRVASLQGDVLVISEQYWNKDTALWRYSLSRVSRVGYVTRLWVLAQRRGDGFVWNRYLRTTYIIVYGQDNVELPGSLDFLEDTV